MLKEGWWFKSLNWNTEADCSSEEQRPLTLQFFNYTFLLFVFFVITCVCMQVQYFPRESSNTELLRSNELHCWDTSIYASA